MADPEEIKRKLRDLRARIASTQESIERVRARIHPTTATASTDKRKTRKKPKSKDKEA